MAWWQKTNSKRPKGWVIALIALVLIVIISAAIARRGQTAEVATVATGPIQHSLVFSSRVASVARTELASTMTARVEKILVREGDTVKAGQLLISLDDDDLRAQLQQAQAALATSNARLKSQYELSGTVATQGLAQSKVNMEFALADLERNRNLHAKGFIGDAKLQDVERAAASARAAYQQAAAQAAANTKGGAEAQAAQSRSREAQGAIDVVKAKLEQTNVVSPSDGRVISRTVEVGDVAQPGKKLLTIATTGETRLIAQIDEKNLRFLREGMRAVASADAFPEEKFDAELFYLSPSVDATRGTVEARLRVAKAPAILRDDMTVSAEVIVAQKKDAITIPRNAIRESGERKFVLVAREGKAQEQDVKLGILSLIRTEIISGLSAGDQVILDERILVGQRIRPVTTTAPANTPRAKTFDLPMPTQ
jgi:HlyD family secretion protein